jgi:hypothetical protein
MTRIDVSELLGDADEDRAPVTEAKSKTKETLKSFAEWCKAVSNESLKKGERSCRATK